MTRHKSWLKRARVRRIRSPRTTALLFICLSSLAAGCGPKPASTPPKLAPVDVAAVRTQAEAGDPRAQAQLGSLYAKGESVTNSYKEAARWFKLAADQGNADGQAGLAELYDAGRGVPRDRKEAVRLYRLAADKGNSGAQYALGFIYETGNGLPINQVEAAKWYRLAAEGGESIAQFDIAQRYELGVGVKADNVEALKWFLLASGQGQKDSVKRADQIKSKMTRAEITEAKKRAAAFMPRTGAK